MKRQKAISAFGTAKLSRKTEEILDEINKEWEKRLKKIQKLFSTKN